MKITGSQTHDPGPVQQLAAQPLLVSVTLGKALAAEVDRLRSEVGEKVAEMNAQEELE